MNPNEWDLLKEETQAVLNANRPTAAEARRALLAMHARMGEDDRAFGLLRKFDGHGSAGLFGGKLSRSIAYGMAAVIVLLVAIVPITKSIQSPTNVTYKTYSTANGQRARITLKDGTLVTLAPATTIRYAEAFGKAGRDVYLQGEALFTVVQSEGAPFIVHVDGASARVLGTVFSVRKYATEKNVRVVVAEGKVSASSAILSTGDAAYVYDSAKPVVQHGADVAAALAWTSGILRISTTPLRQAIPELERWYGLKIKADDALLDQRVTMSLQNESQAEVVAILTRLLQCRAERVNNVVTLSANLN